ncbi:damage-inducible protein DinB [Belliella sp. DSM 111904]|uniref:Damage-inducible protein DinB n=1 Tax=Belliella filtrata TaxID=2923435 RepID=A0ABS9V1Z1_9BACT|nr:DinB family protein [Belliella filtrata]MCH7410441.1 damage-inducible protein DinB [Belliella filtrata]
MKDFFLELFEYNFHSNQKLIAIFNQEHHKLSGKALELFSHILNAHQIWNNRINPRQKPFGVWQIQDLNDFKNLDQANYEQSKEILEAFDLLRVIDYKNSHGQAFSNNVKYILFHIINHSTYHRAQITSELRACEIEPISTDFIWYKR